MRGERATDHSAREADIIRIMQLWKQDSITVKQCVHAAYLGIFLLFTLYCSACTGRAHHPHQTYTHKSTKVSKRWMVGCVAKVLRRFYCFATFSHNGMCCVHEKETGQTPILIARVISSRHCSR